MARDDFSLLAISGWRSHCGRVRGAKKSKRRCSEPAASRSTPSQLLADSWKAKKTEEGCNRAADEREKSEEELYVSATPPRTSPPWCLCLYERCTRLQASGCAPEVSLRHAPLSSSAGQSNCNALATFPPLGGTKATDRRQDGFVVRARAWAAGARRCTSIWNVNPSLLCQLHENLKPLAASSTTIVTTLADPAFRSRRFRLFSHFSLRVRCRQHATSCDASPQSNHGPPSRVTSRPTSYIYPATTTNIMAPPSQAYSPSSH